MRGVGGHDLAVTWHDLGAIPVHVPVWPRTESGLQLREAYLRHAERALLEHPDLAVHCCDTSADDLVGLHVRPAVLV